jgi:type IV pilus assembly protein PilC
MFKVGEESGNMEDALKNISFFYDREINDSIDRLVGLIQPTITIVMGGMIGWITIAVFGPIYGTFSNIG